MNINQTHEPVFVDARGLSCPQPVILARQAILDGSFPILVLVDTASSRENIRRMAENSQCTVRIDRQDDDYQLVIERCSLR
jgi:tRNA 2-thiouridine synthesizing protein A